MQGSTFGFSMPFGALGALALGVAFAILVVLSVRAARGHRRARLLIGLRVASLAAAFLVASQPSWSSERSRRVPGRLAVVVDASRSMGVGREGHRRWDRVRTLLARWGAEPAARRTTFYTVASTLEPGDAVGIAGAPPRGEESKLLDGLDELVRADARDEVGAVVLVSDGAETSPRRVDALDLSGVRVHTVAVADEQRDRDDALVEVRPDARAFLRMPYRIAARVRAVALAGETVPVTLERSGQRLETRPVTLDDRGEGEVAFEVMPERVGRVFHRLLIPIDPEDVVPENNSRSLLVRVGRDRLRVLLVAGHPTWDVRFLRSFLERDPTNDLISFFILRTETDMSMADSSEMSLIPFPTDELFREHLSSFDVVVFQDFDFGPYRMDRYLPLIERYVAGGGSFAMIGGDKSFTNGGYVGTPIEGLLPVRLISAVGSGAVSTERFRPMPIEGAELHPLVALRGSPEESRALFGELAESLGTNIVRGLAPGATALLAHPTLRDDQGGPMPVLSVREHQRGRSLALTTDTSYRWGIATAAVTGDGSVFERFWDRAIRWLARDPALEPCQVMTDRERYGLGAEVAVQVLARLPSYAPRAGVAIRVALLDESGRVRATYRSITDPEGRAGFRVPGPEEAGVYRLVASLDDGDVVLADEAFVTEASGDELADPRPNPDFLRAVARRTRGTYYASVDDVPALAAFDRTRERSLGLVTDLPFRSPWFVALALTLLGAEWIVRRRLGGR